MADETQTVMVGDTEVQITETDDGFEVEEAETGPEPGLYLRFQSTGRYGGKIPLGADFNYEYGGGGSNPHRIAWNSEDDVDTDLKKNGSATGLKGDGLDCSAVVADVEIVVEE